MSSGGGNEHHTTLIRSRCVSRQHLATVVFTVYKLNFLRIGRILQHIVVHPLP